MPQQDTSSDRSSTLSAMSVISGGTAPKGFSAGGSRSSSAGSAGIVMTFSTVACPSSPRRHIHTDALRSAVDTTTPTNPYGLLGSWAGRSSSTI